MGFEQYSRWEIGSLLLQIREKSHLTQKQLAKKARVSPSTVSNVEKAKGKRASQQTIKRLFGALDVGWENIPQLLKKEAGRKDQFLQMIQLQLTSIENQIDYGCLKEGKSELKKIEAELKDHPLLVIVHYLKGKYFFRRGKDYWDKAYDSFQDSIAGCSQYSSLSSSNVAAASHYELSRIYSRSNNYQEALLQVENGLQVFDPEGERKSTKYVLLISKVIYLEKLKRNTEAKSVLEYMQSYEGELDTETKLNMYQSEVNLLYRERFFEKAIERAKKAIDIARREKNYDRSFEMWTTLGSIYKDLSNLEMAKVCFETAAQWKDKIKDVYFAAYNEIEVGKLYSLLGDFSLAESHLQSAIKLSENVDDAFYQFEALNALSELWIQHGRNDEGIKVLKKAFHLAHKHVLLTQEKNTALKLAELYKGIDQKIYQDYLTRFYETSVKLSGNGGEGDMISEDLNRRAGSPPDN